MGLDESLTVLLEELPGADVGDGRDLDELCEPIADLTDWEGLEEGEVEEGHDGGMVGTETVLELAVVDANLNGDSSIDEADDGGRDSDEVGVSPVRGACETADIGDETTSNSEDRLLSDQSKVCECIDKLQHGVHGLEEGQVSLDTREQEWHMHTPCTSLLRGRCVR